MAISSPNGEVDPNGAQEVNLRTSAGAELLGQQTSAASLPVVIASNQTVPISAVSLPLPTGAATESTLSSINTKTPALGQATMANSSPVVIASNQSTIPHYKEESALTNKIFSATFESTVGTSEINLCLLRNPGGSGKTLQITAIVIGNYHTVTSGVRFRFYTAPTVTSAGTSQTIARLTVGSATAPVATFSSAPTTSALGTRFLTMGCSTIENSGSVPFQLVPYVQLPAGQDILVTAQAGGTNRVPAITIFWQEI